MMNLVVAANGLIGQAVTSRLKQAQKPFKGTVFSRGDGEYCFLDITDFEAVHTFVTELKPSHIYLCANMPGGVNRCEEEYKNASVFHVEATRNIAQIAKRIDAKLIYISSDYVFSDSDIPYNEEDKVSPLNIYGELKVAAEQSIKEEMDNYIIARTTNVYGWDPETKTPNFFMGLYRKLKEGVEVGVPSALFGNPTYVEDLARALVELADADNTGTFHIVGPECLNRYQWATLICDSLECDKKLIKKIDSFKNIPQRPLKAQLSTSKLKSRIGWQLRNFEEAFKEMKIKMS